MLTLGNREDQNFGTEKQLKAISGDCRAILDCTQGGIQFVKESSRALLDSNSKIMIGSKNNLKFPVLYLVFL